MNIFICMAILCGGILIGFLLRCVMIMEYNDGVADGYERCREEHRIYDQGWTDARMSGFTLHHPSPSDLPKPSFGIEPEEEVDDD